MGHFLISAETDRCLIFLCSKETCRIHIQDWLRSIQKIKTIILSTSPVSRILERKLRNYLKLLARSLNNAFLPQTSSKECCPLPPAKGQGFQRTERVGRWWRDRWNRVHFPSIPVKHLADLRSRANSQRYSSIYEDRRPKIEDTERSDSKKSA